MRTFFLSAAALFALLTPAGAQPVINAGGVVNAASYQPGIAPGSIFVVFGSNLGPATLVQASSLPLEDSLAGTKVHFEPAASGLVTGQRSAASSVDALMVYTSAGQVAALLPKGTAPGSYTATVTFNSQTSAGITVTVVKRNLGIVTADASGAGQAQATYGGYDLNRFTNGTLSYAGHAWLLRPAIDGDTIIFWGTGAGDDPNFNDADGTGTPTNMSASFTIIIAGVTVHPTYVGRSPGGPGLDQVNVKLPTGVVKGCFIDVVISWSDPSFSNHVTVATANKGDSSCQGSGLTAAQMHKLDTGGTLVIGELSLLKTATDVTVQGTTSTLTTESAAASFSRYTGGTYGSANFAFNQSGSCHFIHRTGSSQDILAGKPSAPVDAGPQLTLNGPNVSNVAIPMATTGIYNKTFYSSGFGGIGGSGSPTLAQGTYTWAGPGGSVVGAFSNASDPFPGSFTPNLNAIPDPIVRSQDLNVTWTGGVPTGVRAASSGAVVTVTGFAFQQTGGDLTNPIYTADGFVCVADAAAGSLTVPASILEQMPVVQNNFAGGSFGILAVNDSPNPPVAFTAPGMDLGFATYLVGASTTRGYN
ncbi:MAG TPA: hypothetical protein VJN43_17605 [Bryobacteraceae bacterium]|nr:hypothetical protein [Bryobacteraceae bacterium]